MRTTALAVASVFGLLRLAEGPLYEYACHEGNYAVANILKGARAQKR